MRFGKLHVYDVIVLILLAILVVRHLPTDPAMTAWRAGKMLAGQGDWVTAAAELDEVVRLQPDFADAQFLRGVALLYADRPVDAEASLAQGMALEPGDAYLVFWHYLAQARGQGGTGGDAEETLRKAMTLRAMRTDRWPGVLGAALLGEVEEAMVLRLATVGSPKQRASWLAEGFFYMGQRKLLEGDTHLAETYFKQAISTRATRDIEYVAAKEELRRLSETRAR